MWIVIFKREGGEGATDRQIPAAPHPNSTIAQSSNHNIHCASFRRTTPRQTRHQLSATGACAEAGVDGVEQENTSGVWNEESCRVNFFERKKCEQLIKRQPLWLTDAMSAVVLLTRAHSTAEV